MESLEARRTAVKRLLKERYILIPRPARLLLMGIVEEEALLARMRFCRPDERPSLRNTLLVSADEAPVWALMLGNTPGAPSRQRAQLVLQGLDLSPAEILDRLRVLPIWFLAIDLPYADPVPGEAHSVERTVYALSQLPADRIRAKAVKDQIDAALEAGDFEACERLRQLLP
jgi:hypothetical protein